MSPEGVATSQSASSLASGIVVAETCLISSISQILPQKWHILRNVLVSSNGADGNLAVVVTRSFASVWDSSGCLGVFHILQRPSLWIFMQARWIWFHFVSCMHWHHVCSSIPDDEIECWVWRWVWIWNWWNEIVLSSIPNSNCQTGDVPTTGITMQDRTHQEQAS